MADPSSGDRPQRLQSERLNSEKYARLRAEARSPYRGLRLFVYFAFSASGLIGAFIFLMQLLAGRDVSQSLPNFALQVGIVALMVWFARLENRAAKKDRETR